MAKRFYPLQAGRTRLVTANSAYEVLGNEALDVEQLEAEIFRETFVRIDKIRETNVPPVGIFHFPVLQPAAETDVVVALNYRLLGPIRPTLTPAAETDVVVALNYRLIGPIHRTLTPAAESDSVVPVSLTGGGGGGMLQSGTMLSSGTMLNETGVV